MVPTTVIFLSYSLSAISKLVYSLSIVIFVPWILWCDDEFVHQEVYIVYCVLNILDTRLWILEFSTIDMALISIRISGTIEQFEKHIMLSGLIGVHCLKLTCVRIGYSVSSREI